MLSALGEAVKAAIEYEQAIAQVMAVTGWVSEQAQERVILRARSTTMSLQEAAWSIIREEQIAQWLAMAASAPVTSILDPISPSRADTAATITAKVKGQGIANRGIPPNRHRRRHYQ